MLRLIHLGKGITMKLAHSIYAVALVAGFAAQAQTPAPAAAPAADVKATIVIGAKAPQLPAALWTENGQPMVARGPDQVKTAPANAVKANIRVHALGGMTFREVTFPKGAKFMTPMGPMDTVVYLVRGRMKVNLGGVTADVGPGDSWRKISGQPSGYEVIEEAVIFESDAKPEERK